jgi:glycosyltransferase involved in cell wall biosynthesis
MTGMKIAHLARWLEVGGTETMIFNLCRLGTGKQWVVGLIDGPMRPVMEKAGIDVRLGTTPEAAVRHLAEADVINVHWLEHFPDVLAPALDAGRPLVFTLHGLSLLPRLPGPVICTSKRAFDLQKHNRDRLFLIPNAVDTTVFRPPAQRRQGPPRIIRVCRPIRSAEYFWPAVFGALEACPEAEVRIVGGPCYGHGRIQGVGDRDDVAEQLAAADVFAYAPWPHEGTLDLVVLEAMACGLPCVVSDVPCVHDSVEHEVTGLRTPFGDTKAFAEALIRLLRDRPLREAMGRRAVEVARERFDFRSRIPLYEAVYLQARTEETAVAAFQPATTSVPLGASLGLQGMP